MNRSLRNLPRSPGTGLLAAGLTLALWVATLPSSVAQEADPASAETESAPPQSEPSPADGAGKKTTSAGEVFVPTEEISEDYAVSFPVDI